jgi:hypothetical protein
MRLERALALALLFSNACGFADNEDVRIALRTESSTSGLALVAWRANDIMVLPFNEKERYFRTEPIRQIKLIGVPGRMIVWLYRPSFLEASQVFIALTSGERARDIARSPASEFVPKALNEGTGRLAFWGKLQGQDSHKGLYWTSGNLSTSTFIDQQVGYCDWARDGSALTYEKEGQIYIFDVATNSSRLVSPGHDPTWSPDGKWIAYRSKDSRPSLVTPRGSTVNWPVAEHEATSPIRWSPDGLYVSFTETIPGQHIPLAGTSQQLIVCRVSDGAKTTVRKFGTGPAGAMNYYWILGYQKFCGDCAQGTPFE